MKKSKLLMAAAILSFGFTGCNNENIEARRDAAIRNNYIDSVENETPVYSVENWTAINEGYQERASRSIKKLSTLSEEEKSNADASQAKYETLKAKYVLAIKEQEMDAMDAAMQAADTAPNFRKVLRDRLLGEGNMADNTQVSFVTSDNIPGIYKKSVNVVAGNKNTYSREDLGKFNVPYKALNTRKNVVEKVLKTVDSL